MVMISVTSFCKTIALPENVFFSHDITTAKNVKRNTQQDNLRVPTQQDFFELPTVRPPERRQELAQSTGPATPMPQMWKVNQMQTPEALTQAIAQKIQNMLPQIITQIKEISKP